ncbi:MAG: Addiction module toxin, RelE/StbE family [candidate division TM6 bacterium GW2011_GWF2_37_49]|nr:MAG: Addiction module toxin, RelE/StbE family [candidate division TM6 bacterium GW2011_GWF2_37_49]
MFKSKISKSFKKDVEKARRQKKDLELLGKVMYTLLSEQPLNPIFQDHQLKGRWSWYRDCHVTSDWVMIYRILAEEQIIKFERLGSHAELFG